MKTFSLREFFRQPRLVQELVEQGEEIAVRRRDRVVFEVRPPTATLPQNRKRRSVGVWSHKGFTGDAAAALPPEENWP